MEYLKSPAIIEDRMFDKFMIKERLKSISLSKNSRKSNLFENVINMKNKFNIDPDLQEVKKNMDKLETKEYFKLLSSYNISSNKDVTDYPEKKIDTKKNYNIYRECFCQHNSGFLKGSYQEIKKTFTFKKLNNSKSNPIIVNDQKKTATMQKSQEKFTFSKPNADFNMENTPFPDIIRADLRKKQKEFSRITNSIRHINFKIIDKDDELELENTDKSEINNNEITKSSIRKESRSGNRHKTLLSSVLPKKDRNSSILNENVIEFNGELKFRKTIKKPTLKPQENIKLESKMPSFMRNDEKFLTNKSFFKQNYTNGGENEEFKLSTKNFKSKNVNLKGSKSQSRLIEKWKDEKSKLLSLNLKKEINKLTKLKEIIVGTLDNALNELYDNKGHN